MDAIAVWRKIDGADVARTLREACDRMSEGDREVVLDFSAVTRMKPDALVALENLAARSEEQSLKVAMRGVSVDVYRVLKLAKLSGRFVFIS